MSKLLFTATVRSLRRLALNRTGVRLAALTILAVLSAVGLYPQPAGAQDREVITFNEAVRIALEQNVDLQRVENTAELSALEVTRSRMAFFPDFSVSGRGSQNYGRNFIADEGRVLNQTTESISVGVGSSINLFNGYRDVAGLRQSQLLLKAGELDYDRARQAVVFQVMSDYLLLVEQREQINVHRENIEAQRQQLAQIEGFVEVGTRPISDLYQQQAAVASAELSLVDAERAYQLVEVRLIQTLLLDPFKDYAFEVPEIGEEGIAAQQYDLGELLETAFQRRIDLEAREADIEAANQGIRVARGAQWPTIGLSLGYGTNYTTADRQFALFDQLDQRRGGSIDLNISLPIFDRYNTRVGIERAQVQLNNARLALEGQRQEVAAQVRQAYLDYLSSAKSVQVSETQVRAAQMALEVEEERYAVGAGTLVELSLARAEYIRAASNQVAAKYDHLFQTKLLDYYRGVLDPLQPVF